MPFEENSSNAVDLLEMWFDRIQLEEYVRPHIGIECITHS